MADVLTDIGQTIPQASLAINGMTKAMLKTPPSDEDILAGLAWVRATLDRIDSVDTESASHD